MIMRKQFERQILLSLGALLISPFSLSAQKTTPPFPRDGATKVQDNDRVFTWDTTLQKGKSSGPNKLDLDQVSVSLTEGAKKFTRPGGTWDIEQERLGSVRYDPKGTVLQEECISDTPCRAMVFQLKDYVPDPWPTREGVPPQFPRINTVKLFETDRITVWDQVWKPGEAIVRHAHYHRTVTVFLQGGTIHTIPDNGIPNPPFTRNPGEVLANVTFNPDAHIEEGLAGLPRAIWIEFTK
jgi:hypothetical protein